MRSEVQNNIDRIKQALDLLRGIFDWDAALARLDALNKRVEDPDLWNDQADARR